MTLIVQNALDPTLLIPVANGGTGTNTPALVAGSNITITGAWPNQTIGSNNLVTLTGSQSVANKTIKTFKENVTLVGAAPSTTTNFDVLTQPISIYNNATSNFTVNVRGNSTTTLDSTLAVGESIVVNLFVPNGATAAYYPSSWTIDGVAITPKYQGGTAYTAGNASATDLYVMFIVKTASATWVVYVSQTKFG